MIIAPQCTTLKLLVDDAILYVRLNRPGSANAISEPMWEELGSVFDWADSRGEIRCVVLAGEGKHFCGGIDLSMLEGLIQDHEDPARGSEVFRDRVRAMQQSLRSLRQCRKPVIAVMHGACVGAAIDMTCYADMRFADRSARFCIKEIDVGLVADVGTLQNLPRLMPDGLVRELAYSGRYLSAEEALRCGFVNEVYDDYEVMAAAVHQLAQTIASKSPLAVRGTKQVINHAMDHPVDDGLEYVALWNAAMLSKADVREAIRAAREKRAPVFGD
jgi:enoyl-CoA hydratase